MNTKSLIYAFSLEIAVGTACLTTPVTAAEDSGSLSVAEHRVKCWAGPHVELLFGYMRSRPLGAYSSTNLAGGQTLIEIYDQTDAGCKLGTGATLSVSGFSGDPGHGWLTSVTCNGKKLSENAAARFSFANGIATWEWTEQFGLQSSVGHSIECIVSHV
jgi:hypothetical protein